MQTYFHVVLEKFSTSVKHMVAQFWKILRNHITENDSNEKLKISMNKPMT